MASEGKSRITWAAMHAAEEIYSQKRLRSVLDEWTQLFPSLKYVIDLVKGMTESFTFSDIKSEVVDEVVIRVAADSPQDELGRLAAAIVSPEGKAGSDQFLAPALYLMYHVGIIGIKPNATSSFSWVYREGRRFNPGDINDGGHLRIHKMFWRELGVSVRPYSYDAD